MTKPITPDEAGTAKVIPDEVITAFNETIALHFDGRASNFTTIEIVSAIVKKGISRKVIFDNHYLDVEPIFEAVGWKVVYDKPGYNESYEANFTFTRK